MSQPPPSGPFRHPDAGSAIWRSTYRHYGHMAYPNFWHSSTHGDDQTPVQQHAQLSAFQPCGVVTAAESSDGEHGLTQGPTTAATRATSQWNTQAQDDAGSSAVTGQANEPVPTILACDLCREYANTAAFRLCPNCARGLPANQHARTTAIQRIQADLRPLLADVLQECPNHQQLVSILVPRVIALTVHHLPSIGALASLPSGDATPSVEMSAAAQGSMLGHAPWVASLTGEPRIPWGDLSAPSSQALRMFGNSLYTGLDGVWERQYGSDRYDNGL